MIEPSPLVEVSPAGDPSSEIAHAAEWIRDLWRTAKTARLYKPDNPLVLQARERLARSLAAQLERGAWRFRVTPTEILLGGRVVVRARPEGEEPGSPLRGETALPFRLYRDGIRGLALHPGIPREDVDALVDALAQTDEVAAQHDLVTYLWQCNPTHLELESAPLEQVIHLTSGAGGEGAPRSRPRARLRLGAERQRHPGRPGPARPDRRPARLAGRPRRPARAERGPHRGLSRSPRGSR